MQTVMGASPRPKFVMFCGTLSSSTRKFPRGMFGMKWPFLSRTETSTVMAVTSLLKLGPSGRLFSFLPYFDGILGSSASAGWPSFFRGLATVSDDCLSGPCCAAANGVATRPQANVRRRMVENFFILVNALSELYQNQDVFRTESVSGGRCQC